MNIYTKVFSGIAAVAVAIGLWLVFSAGSVQALTDRKVYRPGDSLEIAIKNNSGEPVCFSNCYPYFLESQTPDNNWRDYDYGICKTKDIISTCVGAGQTKEFQLSLAGTAGGAHRIKIPVCVDCAAPSDFSANTELYSNVFQIQ